MTNRKNGGRINVLFIVPSLRRAGAETQVVDLVNGLDGGKFNKTLVAFEPGLDLLERLDTKETDFYHFVRKHKMDMSMVPRLASLIDERDIDIIHCTLQISLLFAWVARHIACKKTRLVVAIHTTLNRSRLMEVYDRVLYRQLLVSCQHVIFVCHTQADFWIRKYGELRKKSVVIYNGVDTERYSSERMPQSRSMWRQENGIPSDAAVVTCVAGFRREKGHGILIQAFSRLAPNVYLVLVGDGVLRREVEASIKERGIDLRVRLLGEISDVRPVLAASELTVLASTSVETFSIAMLESMSMGVPVVATNIGGLGEAIDPGVTGELVEAGSVDALYRVLNAMLSDRDRLHKMGQRARRAVEKTFSKSVMVERTEEMLINVFSESRY